MPVFVVAVVVVSCHLACLPINSSLLRCQHCGWHLWMLLLPSLIYRPSPAPLLLLLCPLDHAGHLTSAACHSALRDLPASQSQFVFVVPVPSSIPILPPRPHPVRVCTCAWLMLILDDIIASSAQRFWEKVFPPDWSIDMTSISRPLIDAAPTVSLTSCLINMHVMSTTLTKWSTICDHLKLTIVSGHCSCHLSWHYSHFLTVNFGNYFK